MDTQAMMSVYLFCNTGYGEAFHQYFLDFANAHPETRCVVVFSGLDAGPHHPNKTVRRIARLWDYFSRLFHRQNMLSCSDINANDFISSIPENSVGVVAGFNQIFSERCISRFQDLINFHPSILPYYRGAIPSYWVLHNGETKTGFSAHRINGKIDAGAILHQQSVAIPNDIDEHQLDVLLAKAAIPYFIDLLEKLISRKQLETNRLDSPYVIPAGYMPSKRKE